MKAISSASNAQFRRWLRLATVPRAIREEGCTLAEGVHLAQAAAAAGVMPEAILLRGAPEHPELAGTLDGFDAAVPRYLLAAALYDRLAPVEQGAGLMLVIPVATSALPSKMAADMVYLDGVQDPGNAGALIRIAAAAGVRHVLAGPGTAALWAPKVLRGAMGAHFRIALHERVGAELLPRILDGAWFAAVAHGAPSLWNQALPAGAIGWILGAEGSGPSAAALAIAQQRVCITTSTAVESLNVAAAAAVCLFERLRRQQDPAAPIA